MEFVSPLIWVTSIVTLLITPVISTHEPPRTRSLPSVGLRQSQRSSELWRYGYLSQLGTLYRAVAFLRVPKKDPNLENYPYVFSFSTTIIMMLSV